MLKNALDAHRRELDKPAETKPADPSQSLESLLVNQILGTAKPIKEVFGLHQALESLTEAEVKDVNQRFNDFVAVGEKQDRELRLLTREQIGQLSQAA